MKAVYIYAIIAICLLVVGTFLLLPEYNQGKFEFEFERAATRNLQVSELQQELERATKGFTIPHVHVEKFADFWGQDLFVASFWGWDGGGGDWRLDPLKWSLRLIGWERGFGHVDVKCAPVTGAGASLCSVIKAYFYV